MVIRRKKASSVEENESAYIGGIHRTALYSRKRTMVQKFNAGGMPSNTSLLPTPLTPLAFAPRVKGSLAALGAAEFSR